MNTITSSGSTAVNGQARRKKAFGYWVGRILLGLLALLVGLATTGAIYQAFASARDQRKYPPL